ncbi:alcohol dehydrogenase [Aspergillus eucalypticola CBS 122712]|uniref:Alcohol dehydrogenase n=1 Tax=Aspergillus eucalypticola (strain CBS 122712 / IBT 29274) TaxID=1448314 RepID=A0A317UT73_ASPEC|nr:alcohol dehydrogenase [Aspergillus eucalypticola CBS 122712]PWY64825.1 alcohol dehydrogenase [Aspergillus eucalypticola CBS 122712]
MSGTTPTHGKTALITGGAQGFGKAIVIKFIAEGARVLVLDIIEPPEEFQGDFSNNITYVRADVTSLDDWQIALEQSLSVSGNLDIVVNNTGVLHKVQLSIEVSDEDWERVFRINVQQIHLRTKTIIPYLLQEKRGGLFINASSTSVWYGASKDAVNTATRRLAIGWAPHNIRVIAVCPSVGVTAMMPLFLGHDSSDETHAKMLSSIPLVRVCQPSDVANTVSFLASDKATYFTRDGGPLQNLSYTQQPSVVGMISYALNELVDRQAIARPSGFVCAPEREQGKQYRRAF